MQLLTCQVCLQDVYKIGGIGTVPVGRVETGVIKVSCRSQPVQHLHVARSALLHLLCICGFVMDYACHGIGCRVWGWSLVVCQCKQRC